ncbi:cobyric acid synthase [Entomobacter blattae]|nr:cobyric acid synthase [Entomobacter blattae]
MFQGTGSNVGKSVLLAGLARAFWRQGVRVRPFKPQNMSNNAAVTLEGGEIGRAQALQAQACGVEPSVHMNPVLLKPQSATGSQIIVQGKVWKTAQAREYQALKGQLMESVMESFSLLSAEADLVLVEGAGSASEINLRQYDIANMGFAQQAGLGVVLVGDIDRGGVIASLVGTHTVLPVADRSRIKGFIVNRMRGDVTLFDEGIKSIAHYTGWPALGLVPYYEALQFLPAEDSLDFMARAQDYSVANHATDRDLLKIVIPVLPGISNVDDYDPLIYESGVQVTFLQKEMPFPKADVILLPGSKTTQHDLSVLRQYGWDKAIDAHYQQGGKVFGICGGYQILGKVIADPYGVEAGSATVEGLGLLDVNTEFSFHKQLRVVSATAQRPLAPSVFQAYEMHMGHTQGSDTQRPFALVSGQKPDGAWSACGRVGGCYLHGLFADTTIRHALLHLWAEGNFHGDNVFHYHDKIEDVLNGWATHLERHVDLGQIWALAQASD